MTNALITKRTGSNPLEAPKKLFFGLLRNSLNCDSIAMVTHSFHKLFSFYCTGTPGKSVSFNINFLPRMQQEGHSSCPGEFEPSLGIHLLLGLMKLYMKKTHITASVLYE